MHILYFHQHFSTPSGSTGIRSYQMARHLVGAGHSVTMVCGSYKLGQTGLECSFHRGKREGIVDGIRVIEYDLSYSNNDGYLRRTFQFVKYALLSIRLALMTNTDLIFATSTPLTAGIPGIVARWLRGIPFVFEVRDLWPELPKAMGVISNPVVLMAMSFLEKASYLAADRCVALSQGISEGIKKGTPLKTAKVMVIPNGCDLELFQDPDIAPHRPEDVAELELFAVFAGTHGPANGLDSVLAGAAELKRRGNKTIRIGLVGDGKNKHDLIARVEESLLDNVSFYPPMPKRELAALLKGADVGIQCLANIPAFYYGTSPNKFFDYIASGLPVLNNYPGWLADMIEEHDCGYVAIADDPVDFADKLEEAQRDTKARSKKGANGLTLARTSFDRNRLAQQWVDWVTGQE